MSSGTRQIDKLKFAAAYGPATPASAAPDWASLANYNHVTIVLQVQNATTVTGSAITVNQAQDTTGTGSKALPFSNVWIVADAPASDLPVQTAVVSNTFTLGNVNSKQSVYVIEIDAPTLDVANGFSAIQVGIGNATAQVVSAQYVLSGTRFGGNFATNPSVL